MHRRVLTPILCLGLLAALAAAQAPAPAPSQSSSAEPPAPPLGLPPVFWPDDNPYSPEKVALGRLLYFDPRLSSDGTISCATCHAPEKAFTDNAPTSTGIAKQRGGRNAPTVLNRAYTTVQFWDGRSPSLEDQAKGPLANPVEMTADADADKAHEAVVGRIRKIPGYKALFQAAFGDRDVTIDDVAKAIATFERTVYSGNAPYDRYKAGDTSAMTESQVRGMKVFFGKGKCDSCHLGFNFSDESFMNVGIGYEEGQAVPKDIGRAQISGREEDTGAFKTPSLRDIALTGPYMHDGSMETLEEVVEHYDNGGIKNPHLSQQIKPLGLSEREQADLVEFLREGLKGEGWQQVVAPKPDEFPR